MKNIDAIDYSHMVQNSAKEITKDDLLFLVVIQEEGSLFDRPVHLKTES